MYLSIVAFIQVDSSTFLNHTIQLSKKQCDSILQHMLLLGLFSPISFFPVVKCVALFLVVGEIQSWNDKRENRLLSIYYEYCALHRQNQHQHWMLCEGMKDDQCYNGAKDKYKISCKISSIEEYFCGLTSHYNPYWNIVLSPPPEN